MNVDTINLTDPAFWQGPFNTQAFAALRRERPVSWHDFVEGPEHGMRGFWSLTRYDDIVAVSQNSALFRNQPTTYIGDQSEEEAQYEGWFLNMDPPRHFVLRSVVQKVFSPKAWKPTAPMRSASRPNSYWPRRRRARWISPARSHSPTPWP
jgi:methyl-branched lipid omega-hydroxylase